MSVDSIPTPERVSAVAGRKKADANDRTKRWVEALEAKATRVTHLVIQKRLSALLRGQTERNLVSLRSVFALRTVVHAISFYHFIYVYIRNRILPENHQILSYSADNEKFNGSSPNSYTVNLLRIVKYARKYVSKRVCFRHFTTFSLILSC